jgi:hypothetical protein
MSATRVEELEVELAHAQDKLTEARVERDALREAVTKATRKCDELHRAYEDKDFWCAVAGCKRAATGLGGRCEEHRVIDPPELPRVEAVKPVEEYYPRQAFLEVARWANAHAIPNPQILALFGTMRELARLLDRAGK